MKKSSNTLILVALILTTPFTNGNAGPISGSGMPPLRLATVVRGGSFGPGRGLNAQVCAVEAGFTIITETSSDPRRQNRILSRVPTRYLPRPSRLQNPQSVSMVAGRVALKVLDESEGPTDAPSITVTVSTGSGDALLFSREEGVIRRNKLQDANDLMNFVHQNCPGFGI